MKCVISSKSEGPDIVVHHTGNDSHLVACLSSIFQQTLLPRKVYVIGDISSTDSVETVRYFNEETVMRTEMISRSLRHTDADGTIHVSSNVIMERCYVEKEMKGRGYRMSVALSSERTRKILDKIRQCNTHYVNINDFVPCWVGLYLKIICWLENIVCHRYNCQVIYVLNI